MSSSGMGGGVSAAGSGAVQSLEKALHAPMPFTTGGQTITDRFQAAKYSLAGSQLGKAICKATTEEIVSPKKKHLDYLLHCTHEPNVSIPQMANLLIERTQNTNWCVVYKSLITIHNIMCYGNERFTQYLASCNCNFTLNAFLDKGTAQGYDMSTHVRRYAKYITEKIVTYRLMAFDFCKVKRGRDDGLLRTMHTDKLLKTLPALQQQIDALLEFQVSPSELTNGVINSCFILLFRDLIRLFACYNDGIINLLEKYFEMNKKQCHDALNLYKVFLVRMDRVAEFLKTAEAVGIDRGEIPDLAKAPSSLMNALEQHLANLEGRDYTPTSPQQSQSTDSAIRQLNAVTDPTVVDAARLDDHTKMRYLQQEQQQMEALKQQRLREMETSGGMHRPPPPNRAPSPAAPSAAGGFNPFLSDASPSHQAASKPMDDLMGLDPVASGNALNPFASFGATPAAPPQQQQQHGNHQFAPNFSTAFAPPQHPPPPHQHAAPPPRPPPAFGSGDTSAFHAKPEATEGCLGADIFGTFLGLSSGDPADDLPAGANNPFLTEDAFGDTDTADDAWAQAAAAESHQVTSAVSNPFSALQHNADALDSVHELQLAPPFGGKSEAATPVTPMPPMAASNPFDSYAPTGTAPVEINRPPQHHDDFLGIYDQTPFAGNDASYTSSPQIHRHMADAQQHTQSGAGDGGIPSFDPFTDMFSSGGAGTGGAGGVTPAESASRPLDLNSTLANLAQNLTIDKQSAKTAINKPVQWGTQPPSTAAASINWNTSGASSPNFGAPAPQSQQNINPFA